MISSRTPDHRLKFRKSLQVIRMLARPCALVLAAFWMAVSQPLIADAAGTPLPPVQSGSMPVPQVKYGSIERLSAFPSRYVAAHNIDIWLPPGYPRQAPYAVLYMFDGQMLFDPRHTWNHESWGAAGTAARLLAKRKVRPFIIVGIWNAGANRESEYFPQKPFDTMSTAQRRRVRHMPLAMPVPPYSDRFLRFLVDELKPYVDSHYRVDPARDATFVMGSSMGGLISLYAISEYPQVFGGAGCLSTHWLGTALSDTRGNPSPKALLDYLRAHAPSPQHHLIYFDHGTRTLDAYYGPYQRRVDQLFRAKGYDAADFRSLVFPGADHTERSWAARLQVPFQFLLGSGAHH